MKILAALKKIKHLDRKKEKAMERIDKWSSYVNDTNDPTTPLYNAEEIRKLRQQIHDWMMEKASLRHRLHKTNLQTTVEFMGKARTLDELLCLQAIVLPVDIKSWKALNRKSKPYHGSGQPHINVVLQYDPKEKDKAIDDIENVMVELNELLDHMTIETDLVEV